MRKQNTLKQKPFEATESFLRSFVYQFLGMPASPTDDTVLVGYIYPGESEAIVINVVDRWVAWKDRILDQLEQYSAAYANEFGSRAMRFDEHKMVAMQHLPEEVITESRAFDYYYLMNKSDQLVFTSKIDNEKTDFENYINFLIPFLKTEIPILYSFFFKSKLPIYFPLRGGMDSHMFMPGRSGWGKSTLLNLLIFDLIRTSYHKKRKHWKRSIIVMEPNADLVTTTLRYRFHYGQKERLVYLDPFISLTCKKLFSQDPDRVKTITKGKQYTFVINPFDLKDISDKNVNYMVQELRNALFMIIDEKPSPQMTAVLNTVLYVLLKKPNTSIIDLMTFMHDDENEQLTEYGMSLPNPIHRKFLKTFRNNKKLLTTKSSIYYKMHSVLSDDNFRRLMIGPSTVDLEYEINVRGAVVLLNFSKGSMGAESAQAFGRLAMSYIFGLVRKRDALLPQQRKSTFMILDEHQNFVSPETYNEVMPESRKYKLGVTLAQQVIGQNTPKETKDLIMGNTSLKVFGDLEPGSMNEICKQIPEVTSKHFSTLKRYNFYVHNAQKKEQGVLKLKVPAFLIDTSNYQYYMNPEQLGEVLNYLIHDSGYYVPIDDTQSMEQDERSSNSPSPVGRGDSVDSAFTPKFKK